MLYAFAPVQGHTDSLFREVHNLVYGGDFEYYTPFVRLESGELRKRDLRESAQALKSGGKSVVQIIFRDGNELKTLVETFVRSGHKRIDLNMGCPFPLQTAKGRGAATISNVECHKAVSEILGRYPDIEFSVKMRLGLKSTDEWHSIIPVLNSLYLHHITLHPRSASMQYGGAPDLNAFGEFLSESVNPVVYNGDITSLEDVRVIIDRFHAVAGVMFGRGALGRPSLINECIENREWSKKKRLDKMMEFHDSLLDAYRRNFVVGEHQLLTKMIPFWEYAEKEIGRKAWKAIKKASNMAKYETAVAMIEI